MAPFHCFINVLNIFKDYIARLLAQPFIYSAELSSAYVSPPLPVSEFELFCLLCDVFFSQTINWI